jgi:hypothetical protein
MGVLRWGRLVRLRLVIDLHQLHVHYNMAIFCDVVGQLRSPLYYNKPRFEETTPTQPARLLQLPSPCYYSL